MPIKFSIILQKGIRQTKKIKKAIIYVYYRNTCNKAR